MRICDKCGKKHARNRLWDYDFCYECIQAFRKWVEPHLYQDLPAVNPKEDCTNCNKEEGWVE